MSKKIKGGGEAGFTEIQTGGKRGRKGTGSVYIIKARQKENAKKLGVEIKQSEDKSKKIDVFKPLTKTQIAFNKKTTNEKEKFKIVRLASIGGMYQDGTPYGDYASYLQKPEMTKTGKSISPQERKTNYLARHSKEPKEKINKAGKKVKTPSYYADKILWN